MGKKVEKDPQKALDNAKKSMNSGITGGLTKAFMGKDFVNDMNAAMDQGQAALDGIQQQQWLAQNGADATAEVVSVQDTGATVNMNPVVLLVMKVTRPPEQLSMSPPRPWSPASPYRAPATRSRSNTIPPIPSRWRSCN